MTAMRLVTTEERPPSSKLRQAFLREEVQRAGLGLIVLGAPGVDQLFRFYRRHDRWIVGSPIGECFSLESAQAWLRGFKTGKGTETNE